jgi:RimJ/RimL family protein N-acetyltransferase
MSEFIKPEKIIIGDFVLKQIPGTPKFAKEIYDIFTTDSDTFKHWFDGGMWKSVDEVEKYYYDKSQNNDPRWKYAMYGIFKNNELLGEIGLSGIDTKNQTGEIGYWLKKSARGQGIVDKLIPAIEELGFEKFNLRKINIWCDDDNIASRKHAEKNGYKLEGIQRERKLWPDGSIHSTAMFGKLKSEYKKTL